MVRMTATDGLFLRAVVAFLALPGLVAFAVPVLLFRPANGTFRPAGIGPLVAGTAMLLWCVRDFHIAGRGTLAPWSPPRELVRVGLYRVSRNPMYVSVLIILCGWALGFRSGSMWIYTAVVAVVFHLRVVISEEPWLARTHGEDWKRYRASVPRWLFRINRSGSAPRGDAGPASHSFHSRDRHPS